MASLTYKEISAPVPEAAAIHGKEHDWPQQSGKGGQQRPQVFGHQVYRGLLENDSLASVYLRITFGLTWQDLYKMWSILSGRNFGGNTPRSMFRKQSKWKSLVSVRLVYHLPVHGKS